MLTPSEEIVNNYFSQIGRILKHNIVIPEESEWAGFLRNDKNGVLCSVWIDDKSSTLRSAPRLERKSFFVAGKAKAKRLGAEDGYRRPNNLF